MGYGRGYALRLPDSAQVNEVRTLVISIAEPLAGQLRVGFARPRCAHKMSNGTAVTPSAPRLDLR